MHNLSELSKNDGIDFFTMTYLKLIEITESQHENNEVKIP
jgi:hypothetical protein